MKFKIRTMKKGDKQDVLCMMEEFYKSEAVATNGSFEIFECDFENCVKTSPYLEGFIFEFEDTILGYAMIAKSFSTEFGKPCIWLEDLYLKPAYRGNGIISRFITYVKDMYPDTIFKLEVERENLHACHVYKKQGFEELPYCEMINFNN